MVIAQPTVMESEEIDLNDISNKKLKKKKKNKKSEDIGMNCDKLEKKRKSEADENEAEISIVTKKKKKKRKHEEEVEEITQPQVKVKKKKKQDVKLQDSTEKPKKKKSKKEKEETTETKSILKKKKKSKKHKIDETENTKLEKKVTFEINPEVGEEVEDSDVVDKDYFKDKEEASEVKEEDSNKMKNAIAYLMLWVNNREVWTFKKALQIWLLKNIYNEQKITAEQFEHLLLYLEGLKGSARVRLLEQAKTFFSSNNVENVEESDNDHKMERARQIIQILSE